MGEESLGAALIRHAVSELQSEYRDNERAMVKIERKSEEIARKIATLKADYEKLTCKQLLDGGKNENN